MNRQAIVREVLHCFKHGELHRSDGVLITDRREAVAKALGIADRAAPVQPPEPPQLRLFELEPAPAPLTPSAHRLIYRGIDQNHRLRPQVLQCEDCLAWVRECNIRGAGAVRYWGERWDPEEPPCKGGPRPARGSP